MNYKSVLIASLLLAGSTVARGQLSLELNDSTSRSNEYNPELGFFQKAHSDIGDPRFMLTDKDGSFTLGVGGTVRASAYYDFNGTLSSKSSKFNVYKITAPSDITRHFGLDAVNSEMHLKAKTKIGKHSIIAFLKVSANDDEFIKLNNAYVSFDGFTVGRVYSFFMDLEAGPKTVDMSGPCSQISATQPLVGFTLPIGKHWTLAASAEKPEVKTYAYTNVGMAENHQDCPDFILKGKYKWDNGHVQLAGLLRNCSWWSTDTHGTPTDYSGSTEHTTGYGIALSGSYRPTKPLEFSMQGYYGEGISKYVNDMDNLKCDLIPVQETNPAGGICGLTGLIDNMKATPVMGGYLSIGYHWTNNLSSYIVGGYSKLDLSEDESTFTYNLLQDNVITERGVTLKEAYYVAANLFYDVNDFCTIGIEANYGKKTRYNFDTTEQGTSGNCIGEISGHASRVNATFIYQF